MTSKVHLRAGTSTRTSKRGTSAQVIEVQSTMFTIRQVAARFKVNVEVNKNYNNSNSNASKGDACL